MDEEEQTGAVDLDQDEDPDYRAPPERSIDDMLAVDKEDTSLQNYKATLLGTYDILKGCATKRYVLLVAKI